MREILFRGFTPYENSKEKVYVKNKWITGKWVVGSYMTLNKTTYCVKEDYEKCPDNTEYYIVFDKMTDWGLPNRHLQADVIPETIGQYTGLTDRNGTKIFEGDICRSQDNENYLIKIGSFIPLEFYSVFGYAEQFIIDKMAIYGTYAVRKGENFIIPEKNSLIILSNIYDNPELLKEYEK